MSSAKRKGLFKHVQKADSESCMRKVSSGYLLSIKTFYSVQRVCLRTAKTLIRLRRCADQGFNDTLTNDIVSFEQLGPGL